MRADAGPSGLPDPVAAGMVAAGPDPASGVDESARSDSAWNRIMAIVVRHLRAQVRQPGYWYLLLVLPAVDSVLFGSIGVAYGDGERPLELLLTGVLLFHLIWHLTLNASLGFLEEVWSSNLLNLMATPLREREFIAGLTIVSLLRTAIGMAVIGLVALGLYAVDPGSAGLALVPGVLVLMVFGWAVSLTVIALVLRWGESAEVFSWGTILLLMPLSGVFYPTDALPGVLQPIAAVIPMTRVFDAMRVGVAGGGIAWGDLAVAAVGSVAVAVGAVLLLRHTMKVFLRKGLVTNFS